MFSDKDRMMRKADNYANFVASAKKDCADTFIQMVTQISEIERNWKGDSGREMVQSLEEIRQSIKLQYDRLAIVEEKMRSRTTYIYNTWPEESDVKDD